jgi:hypothetical protein
MAESKLGPVRYMGLRDDQRPKQIDRTTKHSLSNRSDFKKTKGDPGSALTNPVLDLDHMPPVDHLMPNFIQSSSAFPPPQLLVP